MYGSVHCLEMNLDRQRLQREFKGKVQRPGKGGQLRAQPAAVSKTQRDSLCQRFQRPRGETRRVLGRGGCVRACVLVCVLQERTLIF